MARASLFQAAAGGDQSALAALRDEFLTQANLAAEGASHYAAPACDLMLCAELMARMAANSAEATSFDRFILASVLLMRSGSCRTVPALETYADVMEEEGRCILNTLLANAPDFTPGVAWLLQSLADAGDEWAATALEQLVDALPADEAAAVAADVAEVMRDRKDRQEA